MKKTTLFHFFIIALCAVVLSSCGKSYLVKRVTTYDYHDLTQPEGTTSKVFDLFRYTKSNKTTKKPEETKLSDLELENKGYVLRKIKYYDFYGPNRYCGISPKCNKPLDDAYKNIEKKQDHQNNAYYFSNRFSYYDEEIILFKKSIERVKDIDAGRISKKTCIEHEVEGADLAFSKQTIWSNPCKRWKYSSKPGEEIEYYKYQTKYFLYAYNPEEAKRREFMRNNYFEILKDIMKGKTKRLKKVNKLGITYHTVENFSSMDYVNMFDFPSMPKTNKINDLKNNLTFNYINKYGLKDYSHDYNHNYRIDSMLDYALSSLNKHKQPIQHIFKNSYKISFLQYLTNHPLWPSSRELYEDTIQSVSDVNQSIKDERCTYGYYNNDHMDIFNAANPKYKTKCTVLSLIRFKILNAKRGFVYIENLGNIKDPYMAKRNLPHLEEMQRLLIQNGAVLQHGL